MFLFNILALCFGTAVTGAVPVMNSGGIPYKISNPSGNGVYYPDFKTDMGPVEYFDVYGEVQTQYSQVYWTRNAPIDLPPALVERFAGKHYSLPIYKLHLPHLSVFVVAHLFHLSCFLSFCNKYQ